MRYFLIIIIISAVCKIGCAQNKSLPLDSTYFLLGILGDYMGRQLYPEIANRVDIFYDFEKSITLKLDSLFRHSCPDYECKIEIDSSGYEIISKQLSKKINSYYKFMPSLEMTMNYDTIYYGKLKEKIFNSDLEKLSFIIGAYVRFGGMDNEIYHITTPNSLSKIKTCEIILKDLRCTDIKYKILRNYTPVVHTVYFRPSQELKKYIINFSYIRNHIDSSWKIKFKHIVGQKQNF